MNHTLVSIMAVLGAMSGGVLARLWIVPNYGWAAGIAVTVGVWFLMAFTAILSHKAAAVAQQKAKDIP